MVFLRLVTLGLAVSFMNGVIVWEPRAHWYRNNDNLTLIRGGGESIFSVGSLYFGCKAVIRRQCHGTSRQHSHDDNHKCDSPSTLCREQWLETAVIVMFSFCYQGPLRHSDAALHDRLGQSATQQ